MAALWPCSLRAVEQDAPQTGVMVVGRSDKEPPLYRWSVVDPKAKKTISTVDGRWGFTPVPPGEYALEIRPQNSETVDWGSVTVAPGKITTVKVNSGVELSPRSAAEKPPDKWFVYDAAKKNKKPLTEVRERWGLVLLPPGEYAIGDRLDSFRLFRVKVAEGEVAKAQVPDLAERLAAVTGVGRKTEKQRDPVVFKKLEEDIERSIRRGAAWLKTQHQLTANPLDLNDDQPTIGVLALLHAGELERDTALAQRCLDYLLRRKLNTSYGTYATAITTMAIADWDPFAHPGRLLDCAQWLVENQGWDKSRKVWGYGDAVPGIGEAKNVGNQALLTPIAPDKELEVLRQGLVKEFRSKGYLDHSCSQFGVLGLHSAVHGGIKIPRKSWELVEQHFRAEQNADGGWGYFPGNRSRDSMNCAGLASLLLARHHLGQKTPDLAVVKALELVAGSFALDEFESYASHHFYYVYGLERVGVLAGTEFLGDHEWYPEGARYLLTKQNPDGSWQPKRGGSGEYLDTCYAILFLRRATLPPVPPKPAMIQVTYEKPSLPPAIVPNVELVLDCSGSMEEKIKGGEDRITNARRVLDKLITEIPDSFNVGFRIFGAQGFWDWKTKGQAPEDHPGWNTDTQMLVPIGPLGEGTRRAEMRKKIKEIECKGATPLCYALLQAREDFHGGMKGPKTVVLISDGLENCGGKMEDVEKAYKGTGIDLVIHVVGFAVTEKEHKVLSLLAKWTKGTYYRADDAGQLAKALKEAAGSLQYVVQNEGGRIVAQGRLNGPGVVLKAGTYQVNIQGISAAPLQVKIGSGQRLQLTLDDAGKLIAAGESKSIQGK